MNQTIKLINFIDLDPELKTMVLGWRNSLEIKQWMYTIKEISLQEHLTFIDSLAKDQTKQYFLVQADEKYIGVIDFCNINYNSTLMGVYKNPHLKGVGKVLMQAILDHAFSTLKVSIVYSEVFANNSTALALYKSCGFKAFSSKIINNKKVICMELKSENRKI